MDRIIKLLIAAAIVFAAWKYAVPWVKAKAGGSGAETAVEGGGASCVRSAERASEAWGSGLGRFTNPPYDPGAWSTFRGNVESRINAAEADCDCRAESCTKAREAMRDLRALVSDLDSTIRTGSSASDFVQRQEAIDNRINEAGDLARAGK
ncbi:MAG TPA: hypothetical protein VEO54_16535 [Thermoanaerobaculia bacterium]|nr:hypothetical protein [Thermoanaerobaculia bacterium]